MVPKILKRGSELAGKIKCVREQNFVEMYGQSQREQDTIRRLFPDNKHCKYLRENCSACDELHRDIGTAKQGDVCPNNPFHTYADLIDKHMEASLIVEEANRWEALIDLNLLPPLENLSAVQFCFVSTVKRYAKTVEMQARASLL